MIERLQRSASGNVRFVEARAPLLQVGPPKDRLTVKLNFPDLSNGPRGLAGFAEERTRATAGLKTRKSILNDVNEEMASSEVSRNQQLRSAQVENQSIHQIMD